MNIFGHPSYYCAWTVQVYCGTHDEDCWGENERVAMSYLEPLIKAGIRVDVHRMEEKIFSCTVLCKSHEEEQIAKRAIEALDKIIRQYDPIVQWAATEHGVVTWPSEEPMPESLKGKRIGSRGRSPKSIATFMGGAP